MVHLIKGLLFAERPAACKQTRYTMLGKEELVHHRKHRTMQSTG